MSTITADTAELNAPYVPFTVLLATWTRPPRVRWAPGRACDFPEDEDGECLFCHGCPGPGGCGECGAPGS